MNRRPIVVTRETGQRLFNLKKIEKRHSMEETVVMLLDLHDRQPGAAISTMNPDKPKKNRR